MTNFKIFPAHLTKEGQKVPLITGWHEKASNDPVQIREWQNTFRERIHFWGIPTGAINGIVALDIDVKKVNGWDSLKNLGFNPPPTLQQNTPSGGSHLLFKAPEGVHVSNSVNSKLGLDTRGDKGWIAYYGFTNEMQLAPAPDWVFKLAPEKTVLDTVKASVIHVQSEIAQGILSQSLESIRNAPQGESNVTLNTESFKVGQLVASGAFTRSFAEQELFKAAKDRGKPDYEARATITSGIDGGLKNPLTCPFPAAEPQAHFKMPDAPKAPDRWTPLYLTKFDLLNHSKLRKPQLFADWSTEDIQITTADGGTGKTTLKLYEAICLALGDRFLGFECKQQGKTLFITGEDTDKKLAAMLGAIMKQMGLFEEGIHNDDKVQRILSSIVIKKDADLCLIAKDKQGFLTPNSQALEKVLQAVEDIRPKMIVFDPIASFWGSESALNDMNKAVTRFMSELVERSHACVEMINHMGKQSSANKDMSQFAGRGGSGLPSNSRVSRVLRSLTPEEYTDMTGQELSGDQTSMLCNINKFSDGSSLFNKPFIIIRDGYLFSRQTLSITKTMEIEKEMSDKERVFSFVKTERNKNNYPTRQVIEAHFATSGDPISAARIKRAIDMLVYDGHMGEKFKQIDNPDLTVKHKALIIVDNEGRES